MDELIGLLIIVGIIVFSVGPVAFILAIVLFNKLGNLERRISRMEFKGYEPPMPPPHPVASAPHTIEPPSSLPITKPVDVPAQSQPAAPVLQPEPVIPMGTFTDPAKPEKSGNMEVKIGVTVALIVGVITVIVGVGWFLKYMVENMTFPPMARVCMVAVGGLAALVVGEITRRRDFEIVAKGITALGFALLYAAVFSGHKVYGLIEMPLAFTAAIWITAAAMLYAVILNEVLVAFLSLLGGYLSPILITAERVLPVQLFGYVLVLSLGAMAAGAFRRWRAVNWLAFAGTFILYTLWFEDFYHAEQMTTAILWLGVFGGLYLLFPILHGLVRKLAAHSEDVALVVVNSMVVFYYLWRMLYADYQKQLALAVAAVGLVHLVMMVVARLRCRDDVKLQSSLGVIGTAFITAAIPLYFANLQPTLIGWAIEAVVLTFIVMHYQSLWTRAMSIIVAGIATVGLIYHLPLHDSGQFKLFLNAPFGTWVFVALAIIVCHGLWRFMRPKEDAEAALLSQVYFVWGRFLLAAGIALEWFAWCDWNIEYVRQSEAYFLMGMIVIAAALFIGFLVRPLCPRGDFVRRVGCLTAVAGAVYTAAAMTHIYHDDFRLFANLPFALASGFVLVTLLGAWFARRYQSDINVGISPSVTLVMTGLILFWVLLSEEIYLFWYCAHEYGDMGSNWRFLAQMYMSVSWAIYAAVLLVLGFISRAAGIRYLSLAIFAVLLVKINVDIATLRTEYRIATFLTTGLVLVGVSFLYQFLKKKGFFEPTVEPSSEITEAKE